MCTRASLPFLISLSEIKCIVFTIGSIGFVVPIFINAIIINNNNNNNRTLQQVNPPIQKKGMFSFVIPYRIMIDHCSIWLPQNHSCFCVCVCVCIGTFPFVAKKAEPNARALRLKLVIGCQMDHNITRCVLIWCSTKVKDPCIIESSHLHLCAMFHLYL